MNLKIWHSKSGSLQEEICFKSPTQSPAKIASKSLHFAPSAHQASAAELQKEVLDNYVLNRIVIRP